MPLEAVAPHLFTAGNLRLDAGSSEWGQVAAAMGVGRDAVRLIRQVHGAGVAVARRNGSRGWSLPEADIVLSDDPAVAIGVRVADCAPVLLADRTRFVVAAAHAGWRGTLQGVAETAVRQLTEEFGSRPEDLIAAIGPCLGPCCGEVGPEVVDSFRRAGHDSELIDRWFATGSTGRPHLDLWQANRDQLRRCGVPDEQIHVAELCTKSHAGLMHSYRAAGGRAGRMVGVIRAR
jgi:hypothetical protein